jgi:DNA adenine methylase
LLESLEAATVRLRGVMLECGDWRECAEKQRHPLTQLYLDPPYVKSTRSYGNEYAQEWSDEDHFRMLCYATTWPGPCVVSGYSDPQYDDTLLTCGWTRHERSSDTNGGTKRVECLWVSPNGFRR